MSESRRRVSRMGSFLLAGLVVLLPVPRAAAQFTSDRSLWIHRADFAKSEPGVVVLSALQLSWRANQEPIMGVTPLQIPPAGFEVFLDKTRLTPVSVQKFAESPEGIDVVLAVDISGPAYAQFSRMREAVKGFVRRLRPGKDRIAILTFGTNTKVSEFKSGDAFSAFTDDVAALETALGEPPAKERTQGTVLYKALTDAIELAGAGRQSQPAAVERVVVVLSDGHDEGVGFDIASPIAAAKRLQVPVFALGLPEPSTGSKYHDVLDRIARESGGVFVPIKDPARLTEAYEKLDTMLKAQYIISVQPPAELRDSREHVLQVVANYEGATLSARVDTRTGLRAAPNGPTVPSAPAKDAEQSKHKAEPKILLQSWLLGGSGVVVLIVAVLVYVRWKGRKDQLKAAGDEDEVI